MRALRLMLVGLVGVLMLAVPTRAPADGGAYIDFNKTHYLPGQVAVGRTSVYVPKKKQSLLDRGPFYAFLLPSGRSLRERGPTPEDAVRLGQFSVSHVRGEEYSLRVSFNVPDVKGAFYEVQLCNDPCTISGFRESLSGTISIVQTAREGELLTEQFRLQGQIAGLRRDVRKGERELADVQGQLASSEHQRSRLTGRVNQLSAELAHSDPVIGMWAALLIGLALLTLAGATVFRRRRAAPLTVPDTIEELEEPAKR